MRKVKLIYERAQSCLVSIRPPGAIRLVPTLITRRIC